MKPAKGGGKKTVDADKQAGALASDWQQPRNHKGKNSTIVGGISVFPMPSPEEKSRGRGDGTGGRVGNSPAGAGAKPWCRRRRPAAAAAAAVAAAGGRRESRGMATTRRLATQGVRVPGLPG
ncbi:hypothetical protein BDA96_02G352700 [Sorghum bicolor]|uniref:Uncharacterized protein n=1 Tax=Sorghum bicolor TaxID=4558 RepID=A0A921RRT5_SORBI|nr:hypothetical protein BDA96_02G352700 [Sorghum bicolor]